MKRWFFRITIGLLLAGPTIMLSFALVKTGSADSDSVTPQAECQVCHEGFHEAWEDGAHANATSDTAFVDVWTEQGRSGQCLSCHVTGYDPLSGIWTADGITCEACHAPAPENHPIDPMPADRSAGYCGNCHTETYFEWQVSGHRQEGLACINCHDPHATGLKAEDTSDLCATCHRERASNYVHSAHSAEGLTCADCHLAQLSGDVGEGHAVLDHSFGVKLSTCNTCHAYQMHDPVEVHPEPASTPMVQDAMASGETTTVSLEPDPVSPLGFAMVSGLIGMASGMILAPWLERWYRKIRREEDE
jgi:predicted CXXCH cytochrome family protein